MQEAQPAPAPAPPAIQHPAPPAIQHPDPIELDLSEYEGHALPPPSRSIQATYFRHGTARPGYEFHAYLASKNGLNVKLNGGP